MGHGTMQATDEAHGKCVMRMLPLLLAWCRRCYVVRRTSAFTLTDRLVELNARRWGEVVVAQVHLGDRPVVRKHVRHRRQALVRDIIFT
jgi:hypothetical protein